MSTLILSSPTMCKLGLPADSALVRAAFGNFEEKITDVTFDDESFAHVVFTDKHQYHVRVRATAQRGHLVCYCMHPRTACAIYSVHVDHIPDVCA